MANLKLNNVVALSETGGVATFGTPSATLKFPTGHVLQVVSYYTTTESSITVSTSDQIINGMTKVITPLGTASDFLVSVRWMGESEDTWDKNYNIHMNSRRVNVSNTDAYHGLAVAANTYSNGINDSSTPDSLAFSTLVSTSSVIGTDITFSLVTSGNATSVTWSNRCFAGSANEDFTSELIITEIAG